MSKLTNLDSWKNENVFKEQLLLNLKELNSYPQHWRDFISVISSCNNISSILDIGCGCGIYYELCKREFPNIIYTGIDYAREAVDLAKTQWQYDRFFQYDFWSLTQEYLSLFDIIHCGALFDVLPNADLALKKLLSLKPKKVIIGRVKTTTKDSYFIEYTAYNMIKTYAYYHNIKDLDNSCMIYDYQKIQINNTIFLELI